jgi:YVTN family beta-propeller protein
MIGPATGRDRWGSGSRGAVALLLTALLVLGSAGRAGAQADVVPAWVPAGAGEATPSGSAAGPTPPGLCCPDGRLWTVSPADPNLLYVLGAGAVNSRPQLELWRSRDGGAAWELVLQQQAPFGARCVAAASLLQAHPTDVQRLFLAAECAGREGADSFRLRESRDQGVTWSTLFPTPAEQQDFLIPTRLLVGRGDLSGRIYLAGDIQHTFGSWLRRSDDDGATWADLALPARGTLGDLIVGDRSDRLYLGLGGTTLGVWSSADGGAHWSDLGLHNQGDVSRLALGAAGETLSATTQTGRWELSLDGSGDPRDVVPLAPSCACLYLAASRELWVIDTANARLAASLPVELGVRTLVLAPDGRRLYLVGDGGVSVLETESNTVVARFPLAGRPPATPVRHPLAVAPDGSKLYVGLDNAVVVLDMASGEVLATIPVSSAPGTLIPPPVQALAVAPDGRRVYATRAKALVVLDAAANSLLTTIPLDQTGGGLAVAPDGKRIYVGGDLSLESKIAIVGADDGAVSGTIQVPASRLALTPGGDRLFAADSEQTRIVDLASGQVAAQAAVPGDAGLALSPDGLLLYASGGRRDFDSEGLATLGRLSILDSRDGTVRATIAAQPQGLAVRR